MYIIMAIGLKTQLIDVVAMRLVHAWLTASQPASPGRRRRCRRRGMAPRSPTPQPSPRPMTPPTPWHRIAARSPTV